MNVTATVAHSTRRIWPDGPLRRWSLVRTNGCQMPLAGGGFGGSYVCDGCSEPVAGVYRAIDRVERRESWLCAACKTVQTATVFPKEKEPSVFAARPALHGMA